VTLYCSARANHRRERPRSRAHGGELYMARTTSEATVAHGSIDKHDATVNTRAGSGTLVQCSLRSTCKGGLQRRWCQDSCIGRGLSTCSPHRQLLWLRTPGGGGVICVGGWVMRSVDSGGGRGQGWWWWWWWAADGGRVVAFE
jgi:hypothetical protein